MNKMFPSLLLLSCLFLTVEYNRGQVLPPRNVSLRRIDDFELELSWLPPVNSVGCMYKVATKSSDTMTGNHFSKLEREVREMEGGIFNVSVKSFCNDSDSEPVVLSEINPDLVTGFQCYVHSPTQTNCSWSPTGVAADFHMFYRYVVQGDDSDPSEIEECSSYIYTADVKTGCSLPVNSTHSIDVWFNATLNNKSVRNVFYRDLLKFVRPPQLNWSVKKSGNEFNISWDAPEMLALDQWTFIINYTECNIPKIISKRGATSHQLPRTSHCQYSMAIKASADNGEIPWSNRKYFDADPGSYVLAFLAVIIPLLITTLTVLGVMCYRKNKANLFPKVPEPRDLLSDICDNNNKITLCNFHVPSMEEDSCKIALVVDPQISKLDS